MPVKHPFQSGRPDNNDAGTIQITPRGKKKLATADKRLQVITSIAGNVSVSASYHSEA